MAKKSERYALARNDDIAVVSREAQAVWAELLNPDSETHRKAISDEVDVGSLQGNLDQALQLSKSGAPFGAEAYELLVTVLSSGAAAKVGWRKP